MNRILVIGAKGMLGRDLVPELRRFFPEKEILEWDVEEIDIRREGETIAKIERVQPAIVINLAGYTDVDGCEINEQEAFAVNAEGMKHIAIGARQCRAKAVYLSTDYVFDGGKGSPYFEEDAPHPLNVYGRSKWKGEQYLQELAEDGLIIRTQWLYGRYGKNFIKAILHQAKEKMTRPDSEKVLSIVNDQIGSPTYTVDLSKTIACLIGKGAKGVFHVANSGTCSWYDFGKVILRLSGMEDIQIVPISSGELNRKAIRPLYSVLSTEKLKKETGINMRPWPEALKEFLSLSKDGERV